MVRRVSERESLSRLSYLFHYWILNVRRLFHMLVGVAFLVLSLAGATVTFSEWELYRQTPDLGWGRFGVVGGFTVLLAIFGLYSFVKARNVR